MTKTFKIQLLSTALVASVLPMQAAQAQTAPAAAADAAPQPAENDQTIIVTGSRIRVPNVKSAIPITSVTGDLFFQTGKVSVGDVLSQLPSLRSTITSANSTQFIGTAGLNLLDLRGLGTQRTLVLQNGRRHVPADLLLTGNAVDINEIPTDLIERVDIVTGGSSAVYGSDAIAGVVNFVLKDHYDGIQIRAQSGVSSEHDAGAYYVSGLAGKNFADDRGNLAINIEYSRQNPLFASDRDYFSRNRGFVTIDSDPANSINGSDGNPDRTFYNDIRDARYSNGGTVEDFNTNPSYNGVPVTDAFTPYVFQPDGTLVLQAGQRIGRRQNSFLGGNGSTFQEGRQVSLQPQTDRIGGNIVGHFDVSPAFKPFIEAKFVHTFTVGGQSGPSFIFRGGILGDSREHFFIDNPFLTAQARGVISSIYAGDPDFDSQGIFLLNRNNVDLGVREERTKRDMYRVVFGARGRITNALDYEVSANYGRFDEFTHQVGNLNVQRFLLAIDAVRDPATNRIVCRAQIDPTAAIAFNDAGQKYLAGDVANCIPLNLFGEGNASQAAVSYVNPLTSSKARAEQFVINGFLSGDTKNFFNLPGGPVGFVVGGEYRSEKQFQAFDEFVQAGVTFSNVIPTFAPPRFSVKEAFGELRVPIFSHVPFADELTLSGAARVSDYRGSTGTVYAYNGNLVWAPVADIRLRANYSRAVRAPALTETYGVQSQNFASNFVDPCAASQIGTGTATRAANCAAAGVPTTYDYTYGSSLEIISGGNTALQAEKSDSYTIGAVVTPRFVPGLSISVDYYSIKVKNVISAPTAQSIADGCYDAVTLTNQFCALFTRNPAGSTDSGGQDNSFAIANGTLKQLLLNYAKLKVRGIDVDLTYNHKIDGVASLQSIVNLTYVLQNDQFLFPTDPNRPDQILFELGDPQLKINWNLQAKRGSFTLGYQLRYISRQVLNNAEDTYSVGGRPPQNADYADVRFYKAAFYHDARVSVDATERFNVYAGVDNLTDRLPQYGLQGTGNDAIYDNRGRYFYVGAVAKF
jgi:outer membrane receptor protein involved in Fe transport